MTDMPTLGFIDNPHAPDVFADAVSGLFHVNGMIRMTFESVRVNHATSPGPLNRVVIGRLVMPVNAAEAFARGLLQFIEQQRQPSPPAQTTQTTPTLQ
jgi:hypothetical protein